MRYNLQTSLIASFALCLLIVLALQVFTRLKIELPELYEQEYQSDLHAVSQVRNLLDVSLETQKKFAMDYGHWTLTYNFMTTAPGGPEYAAYIKNAFDYPLSIHRLNNINGVIFLTADGDVFFETNYDLKAGLPGLALESSKIQFLNKDFDGIKSALGGVINSNLGPILYTATQISDDEDTKSGRGYLVTWRKINERFLTNIATQLEVDLSVSNSIPDQILRAISATPAELFPRDQFGRLLWLIRDVNQQPILLVTQQAHPRTFSEDLISITTIIGFSTSAGLLLIITFFVSRHMLSPVLQASEMMQKISITGDYKERLSSNRQDELGDMFRRFDDLLGRIEQQEARLREQNTQLEKLADIDPLTGIPNRRFFDRVFDRCWRQSQRSQRPLSCVMIDVDHFKFYNDHYGHPAGDKVLEAVANALDKNIHRATDYLSRFGGEEFILVLLETDGQTALSVGTRMVNAVRELKIPHEKSLVSDIVTISVGVSSIIPFSDEHHALIKHADVALYKAKSSGRNQAVLVETPTEAKRA